MAETRVAAGDRVIWRAAPYRVLQVYEVAQADDSRCLVVPADGAEHCAVLECCWTAEVTQDSEVW